MRRRATEMSRGTRIVLFLMSAGLAVYRMHAAQPSWRPYTSESGGYSVTLPGPPVEEINAIPVEAVTLYSHMVRVRRGGMDYWVSYTDYPTNTPSETTENGILHATADNMIRRYPLLTRTTISIGNVPGIDLRYTNEKGLSIWFRNYQVNYRVYSVAVASRQNLVGSSNALQFMNSFRLTSAPPSPAT